MDWLPDNPIPLTDAQECQDVYDKEGCRHVARHLISTANNALEWYVKLIDPIRAVAKNFGYAVAAHGSLVRDIDLIAVPWTDKAVDAETLASGIANVAKAFNERGWVKVSGPDDPAWKDKIKPHGRLCWSIHLEGGTYIDLSVMPRLVEPTKE